MYAQGNPAPVIKKLDEKLIHYNEIAVYFTIILQIAAVSDSNHSENISVWCAENGYSSHVKAYLIIITNRTSSRKSSYMSFNEPY